MPKSIRVIHLDDQPEQASWIPRNINNWFWKHFRDDMTAMPFMTENDSETEFTLHVKAVDDELHIEYTIFEAPGDFFSAIKAAKSHVALIVLDQAIKDDFAAGGRAYRQLEKHSEEMAKKVIVLTAYPGVTCTQLHWSVDDTRLIAKPPDAQKVLRRFIDGISDVLSPATRRILLQRLIDEEAV